MILRIAIVAALAVALCSPATAADGAWVLREDGIGPIKVGMTLAQLRAMLGEKLSLSYPQDTDDNSCFYADSAKHPDIAFMMLKGRLARIDVSGRVSTAKGIRIGDPEAAVIRAYPNVKIESHAYTGPEGHYLTAASPDGRYGIRFETDGKKVVNFYAGLRTAVSYIEGCE
jgi:hypothetical protein